MKTTLTFLMAILTATVANGAAIPASAGEITAMVKRVVPAISYDGMRIAHPLPIPIMLTLLDIKDETSGGSKVKRVVPAITYDGWWHS